MTVSARLGTVWWDVYDLQESFCFAISPVATFFADNVLKLKNEFSTFDNRTLHYIQRQNDDDRTRNVFLMKSLFGWLQWKSSAILRKCQEGKCRVG